jgi:hypothetical protein
MVAFRLLSSNLNAQPGPGAWTNTGNLITGRGFHTATLLPDGKVLATGGFGGGASAEIYDPSSGTWAATGSLSLSRIQDHTATLLPNGLVLVAAGLGCLPGQPCEATSSAELYNPTTGLWSGTGSLNVARAGHTATLLPTGEVLVAGGIGAGIGGTLFSAELYDPRTGAWTDTGNLNVARGGHTATLLPDGRVLVAGGYPYSTAATELYDPVTRTWTRIGDLKASRALHTATLLANGKVLVAGGVGGGNLPVLSSAELFDPGTLTWSFTGAMNSVRYFHTASLLPDGRVLATGGSNQFAPFTSFFVQSAETFDPTSGAWTGTGNLNTARAQHTVTTLLNGAVLAAGGSGNLRSAELFQYGCPFAISPQIVLLGPGAANGVVNVGTQVGCNWVAFSKVPWISITAGQAGSGGGAVGYSVLPNLAGTLRTGTITIAGQDFEVSQASHPGGDMDGNGRPDLLWQEDANRMPVVWYMGGPDGSAVLDGKAISGPVFGWRLVANPDLDGNGKPDLLWQEDATRALVVWYMSGGDGAVLAGAKRISDGIPGWTMVASADLDGSGKPDLLWREDATGALVVWYMGGADGSIPLSGKVITVLPGWLLAAAADLDGNGRPDLLWLEISSRTPVVWYMGGADGTTPLGGKAISAPIAGWTLRGAADLDGNGKPDLLWQEDANRMPVVWFMGGADGSIPISGKAIGGPVPGWRVAGPK